MSSLLCLYSLPGELTQALGSSLPLYFFPFSLPHFSLSDLALCKTTKLLRYLAQLFLLFFFLMGLGWVEFGSLEREGCYVHFLINNFGS